MALTLDKKLKLKNDDAVLTIQAPPDFSATLQKANATIKTGTSLKSFQQVHWFVKSKNEMEKALPKVLPLIEENIVCWVYYPKGSSGIQTDLTRDKGWDALLKFEGRFTWISLISFDDTWSAFGFRNSNPGEVKKAPAKTVNVLNDYIDPATKTVRLPPALNEMLKASPEARRFFESLSYSNRKEYVEWIVTAKQESTRKTRLEGTVERLLKQWKNPSNR